MESPFTARAAILQSLRHGPGYGKELVERIFHATRHRLATGTAYPALKELQGRGLVRAWKVVPGGRPGGRSRTYYELTYRGLLRAQADAVALGSLLKPEPIRHAPSRPSPSTLRRRLARVSDLIAFTEDLRLTGKSRR